jgi:hypothetical protein
MGSMDGLLNVDDLTGESNHQLNGPFENGFLLYQDWNGIIHQIPIAKFGEIVISSDLGQNVTLQTTGGGNLKIRIHGNSCRPVVNANQHRKKHRYVVSNSGAIEKVTVDGVPIYDTAAGSPTPPAAAEQPIVYTSVVLNRNN